MNDKRSQNYINHIQLVIDKSASMQHLTYDVVKVVDNLIAYLAQRSKELDQETRITVYLFNHIVECVIYDKDVLRLSSIKDMYEPFGRTALIDATMLSIQDLRMTPQKYGDHAFLTYVLTDGQENDSHKNTIADIRITLNNLRENETVAVLVPDQTAKFDAKSFGFPTDNIAVWDASTAKGLSEAAETIRVATDNYMTSRASGVRSTRSLFTTGLDAVNKATVNSSKLIPVARDAYDILNIDKEFPIREWVQEKGYTFQIGKAFYELTKTESIQPQKQIVIQNKHSGRLYTGAQARDILGLPNMEVRVKPDKNPEYRIFVQSTSVNRKLVPKTKLLLMK